VTSNSLVSRFVLREADDSGVNQSFPGNRTGHVAHSPSQNRFSCGRTYSILCSACSRFTRKPLFPQLDLVGVSQVQLSKYKQGSSKIAATALSTLIRENNRVVVDGKRQALTNATAARCSNRFCFPCVGALKVDPRRQLDLKS
jgi:hypothetical protein